MQSVEACQWRQVQCPWMKKNASHFSLATHGGCAVAWLEHTLTCAHQAYLSRRDWRVARLHLFEAERLLALISPCLDRAPGYAGWPTWKVAHQSQTEVWPLSVTEVLFNIISQRVKSHSDRVLLLYSTHLGISGPLLIKQFCNDSSLEHVQVLLFRACKVLLKICLVAKAVGEKINAQVGAKLVPS